LLSYAAVRSGSLGSVPLGYDTAIHSLRKWITLYKPMFCYAGLCWAKSGSASLGYAPLGLAQLRYCNLLSMKVDYAI